MKKVTVWLEYCKKHKKKHKVSMQACSDCNIHQTPQPVSSKVHETHIGAEYQCDGCQAYQDHLN